MTAQPKPPAAVFLSEESCVLSDFRREVERETRAGDYPLSAEIAGNVPIYDAARIRAATGDRDLLRRHLAEWNRVFLDGPGIAVFRGAFPDTALIDDVSDVLLTIMAAERRERPTGGDHFAKAGANARLWNAHEKLCVAAPELFVRYNANEIPALASRAWLGPLYQITTQVNLVYPGSAAQTPHRDYHMGFQTSAELAEYPAHVHRLSAALTLQGAIAHVDMPVESGPTKLLAYSQRYLPGYFACQLAEFRDYFEAHYTQLALAKGDAMFFNPAVFHAAGANRTTDIERLANLLQVGSGYGRSIEIVGRARMTTTVYPVLAGLARAGRLSAREIETVIAGTAEGYPFPADLDIDSPLSGMAPPSQQDFLRQALVEGWPTERLVETIAAYEARRADARPRPPLA